MKTLCRGLTSAEAAVALASACNLAFERGLVAALAGNASCRTADGFLCTPTGSCLGELNPEDLVRLDAAWVPREAARRQSSEWRLHKHIYLASDRSGAVLHTHSPCATAMACAGRDLEEITPEIAHFLGRVPCLPFAVPGSEAVGEAVAEAIARGARASLLGRHGAVAWGRDVREAYHQAELLEAACALAISLHKLGGSAT